MSVLVITTSRSARGLLANLATAGGATGAPAAALEPRADVDVDVDAAADASASASATSARAAARALAELLALSVAPSALADPARFDCVRIDGAGAAAGGGAGSGAAVVVYVSRAPTPEAAGVVSPFLHKARLARLHATPAGARLADACAQVPVRALLDGSCSAGGAGAGAHAGLRLEPRFASALAAGALRESLAASADRFEAAERASAAAREVAAALARATTVAALALGHMHEIPLQLSAEEESAAEEEAEGSKAVEEKEAINAVAAASAASAPAVVEAAAPAAAGPAAAPFAGAAGGPRARPRRRFRLFVGDLSAAQDLESLERLGVTHVVNACVTNLGGPEECAPHAGLRYAFVRSDDTHMADDGSFATHEAEDPSAQWPAVVEHVRAARRARAGCLVHCFMGVNRSVSTAAVFMALDGLAADFEDGVKRIKAVRGQAGPLPSYRRWGAAFVEAAAAAQAAAQARGAAAR
jgi:predicted protein tyrosine phosphatase